MHIKEYLNRPPLWKRSIEASFTKQFDGNMKSMTQVYIRHMHMVTSIWYSLQLTKIDSPVRMNIHVYSSESIKSLYIFQITDSGIRQPYLIQ